MRKVSSLTRRLLPLYATMFFIGLVFWYPIEKVFMKSIGYTDATIGLVVTLIGVTMLVAGIPSGILADRWSRKGVLMIAIASLGLSALIGGLSTNAWTYAILGVTWGLFYALYDGVFSSIIYDTLLEEHGQTEKFAKYYGRNQVINSIALITGSFMSMVMVKVWDLNMLYFASIPAAILAMITLSFFREPHIHEQQGVTFKQKFKEVSIFLRQKGRVRWIIAALFSLIIMQRSVFELYQLWLIALLIPLVLFGPISALMQSSIGLGGILAPRLAKKRSRIMIFLGLLLAAAIATTVKSPIITIAGLAFMLIAAFTLNVIMDQYLHNELDSHIRAGGMSIAGTLGEIGFFIFGPLLGYVSSKASPFAAGWVMVVIALGVIATTAKVVTSAKPVRISAQAQVETEQYQK